MSTEPSLLTKFPLPAKPGEPPVSDFCLRKTGQNWSSGKSVLMESSRMFGTNAEEESRTARLQADASRPKVGLRLAKAIQWQSGSSFRCFLIN